MSDRDQPTVVSRCVADGGVSIQPYPLREAEIQPRLSVRRALPAPGRRLVGPWCFLDHFGPFEIGAGRGIQLGPHPHIGLQTVTWLIEGEILHRDSLGCEQLIRPRQLNIMTAGRGIAHSEETPAHHGDFVHGLQMWLALPREHAAASPAFDHFDVLPTCEVGGSEITIVVGRWHDMESPAPVYSSTVALELRLHAGEPCPLPLDPAHEHALLPLHGDIRCHDVTMAPGTLWYFERGRRGIELCAPTGALAFLIGGERFAGEPIVWWNFVASDLQTIRRAREDWQAGRRFGAVTGATAARVAAPPFPHR